MHPSTVQIFASESRSIRNAVPFHSAVIEFLFTPERSESTLAEVIPYQGLFQFALGNIKTERMTVACEQRSTKCLS